MIPIKNKNKRFWRKNQTLLGKLNFQEWKGTRTRRFSYENYIISITTLCSLKTCNPSMRILSQEKIHLLPFKSPTFFKILVP